MIAPHFGTHRTDPSRPAGRRATCRRVAAPAGRRGREEIADYVLTFRNHKLAVIEAKAVGIRIDSTKRLKELNDKFTDWEKSRLPITTVGVCAGFFTAAAGRPVVHEEMYSLSVIISGNVKHVPRAAFRAVIISQRNTERLAVLRREILR